MNPLCVSEGVGLIPWSPLARGVLAGNRKANTTRARTDDFGVKLCGKQMADADQRVVDRLEEISKKRGVPPAQIALAWLLHKPGVTAPVIGASKPHHLQDAVAALAIKLSTDEMEKLESVYVPHPVLGHH